MEKLNPTSELTKKIMALLKDYEEETGSRVTDITVRYLDDGPNRFGVARRDKILSEIELRME